MYPHLRFQGIKPRTSPSHLSHQSLCLVANQPSTAAPPVNISIFTLISHILSTYAKRPLPSLHVKVVHTHWLKLFNFQLFLIASFYKSLHYTPYFLQTLHNICIIYGLKSLQSLINTKLIYPMFSLSGTVTHPLSPVNLSTALPFCRYRIRFRL